MKRELFENVKVIPGGTAVVIDRSGFLSAIIGAAVAAPEDGKEANLKKLSFTVTHADAEDGEYTPVDDPYIGINGPLKEISISEGETANVEIDLLGCKRYLKIMPSTDAAAVGYAVVLGDPEKAPV